MENYNDKVSTKPEDNELSPDEEEGIASAVRVDTTGDGYPETIFVDEDGDGEPDVMLVDTNCDGFFDTTVDLRNENGEASDKE